MPLDLQLRRRRDAMAQRRQRHALDVVGRDEVAAGDERAPRAAARASAMPPRGPAPARRPLQVRVARAMRTA